MRSNKVVDVVSFVKDELAGIYDELEIIGFITLLFEEYLGMTRTDMVFKAESCINESDLIKINDAVKMLKREYPVQYIIGKSFFMGHVLKVTADTLIPRPETEELVDMVIKDCKKLKLFSPSVLDIGTGSGCIAVSIKSELPDANVSAVDVSKAALKVAMENAIKCDVAVSFSEFDITDAEKYNLFGSFDLIISNPPYVTEKEKQLMRKNVLEHEPHKALFVPDEDPLKFYRHIGAFAKSHLKPDGRIYLEINSAYGNEKTTLYRSMGFSKVLIKKDMQNKDRFARISF